MTVLLLLSGCVSAPQTKTLLLKQNQITNAVELVDVPFFAQKKYQCGPAALATVLKYHGIAVLPDDLTSKVYVPKRQGSFQLEMQAAIRQYGLVPYIIEPNMESLIKEIEEGYPVLVLQNVGLDIYPIWHFSVVIGYDLATSQILLRSGTTKRWQTSLSNFEQTWRRSNYWGIVITSPNRISATAKPNKWLKTALDLQKVNQEETAQKAYMAATKKWPNELLSYLSLANLYYEQKNYADALKTMNNVTSLVIKSDEYWNNYAYVLLKNHCLNEALQAVNCALQQNPKDKNILNSKKEIEQKIKQIRASLKVSQKVRTNFLCCPKVSCSH